MKKEIFTFIVGGKAGEGVKKAGSVAASIFAKKGLYVFQMDDYMSLIRGGHNFSVISTSEKWISSHYMNGNVITCFDKRSYEMHSDKLAPEGYLIYNSDEKGDMDGIGIPFSSEAKKYPAKNLLFGVGAVASMAAVIGMKLDDLNETIKHEFSKGTIDNLSYAKTIYELTSSKIDHVIEIGNGTNIRPIIFGNQAIALGAIASGLNVYYAYPMTPASSLLHYLAAHAEDIGLAVIHAENEIAVINMAIGSAFSGARTMVGTSGGGFALMVEGFSLAGMTEAPLLCLLSMRPGPATGVPTYTEQSDLNFALSAGHGEFLRIVASPGTIEEAFYLSAELLDLVWKFQTPGILLTEKHLSESSMTVDLKLDEIKIINPEIYQGNDYKRYRDNEDGISQLLFPPSSQIIKWNSYEHDENGITTEDPHWISRMHDKRIKKINSLKTYMKKIKTVNIMKGDLPLNIITYGSTTMSVLEALKYRKLTPTVIQPLYLNPLPIWELSKFKDQINIVIEMSSTEQFANLLREKVGYNIKKVIKKFDGRPFDPIELSTMIKEAI